MKPQFYRQAVIRIAAVLFVALAWSPRALSAQGASAVASAAATVTLVSGQDEALPPASNQVEPAGEVLPMSMRPLYHVYAAFGLAWLLIFGYAVSLRRRMTALEREVEQLTS